MHSRIQNLPLASYLSQDRKSAFHQLPTTHYQLPHYPLPMTDAAKTVPYV
ncbi:hypothetical protein H6G17_02190 [Chroococcidiopsis sp. FACHB-1243]|nr:hypothetical protein [Chroococcidiopsis sp. [FACHB-1243]]MBD2304332.1 hypothetical protein [Chroococcidiopsis sp. [FACHB-1243]]